MANGLFIGLTEEELLAIRTKAVALITEGKTLMSYSDSGSSANKQFSMPPKEMLQEANYALRLLAPSVYGKTVTVIQSNYQNRLD